MVISYFERVEYLTLSLPIRFRSRETIASKITT